MNKKPIYIKIFLVVLILSGTINSCKKEYLNVSEPSAISPNDFPASLEDLDLMLIDIYGRLRSSYFFSEIFDKVAIGLDHTTDQGYNGAGFNEWCQTNLLPTNVVVSNLWNSHYQSVSRTNAFLEAAAKFRSRGISSNQEAQVKLKEAQAYFIRAFDYYHLVQFFGESAVITEADKDKLGVPLWDKVATSISETNKERAKIGDVWNFIIADLLKAETLLTGTVWDAANRPRADVWAVKSLLGKAYVFTLQWDKARDKFKEVIEQSGKKLVPYDTYRKMFNGENEFNTESIFEINYTADTKDIWNNTLNTSTQLGIFISPSYVAENGNEATNGFGNLFIHDANIRRFGFTLPAITSQEQKDPAYIAQSIALRNSKQIDPRILVGTLQPYVDSIFIDNVWRKVAKNRGEGFDLTQNKAWCHRKNVVLNRSIYAESGQAIATNMYFLRLADIYLLYAESLIKTGNSTLGLEYINKIKRRAYDLPVDSPSLVDYASLSSATMAAPADHLYNDPLKYERWAELFAEGHWWFDVCRWRIGDKEAAYYVKVKSGILNWKDSKYALPIPESEMNNNNKIQKQNDGY
jgi:starch-binding outer membrane protein, SusD/RagB family